MRKPRRNRARLRLRLQEKIFRTVHGEEYRNVLLEAVRTYFHLNEREQAEEIRLIYSETEREVREEMLTAFDKLRLEGRQAGERDALLNVLVDLLISRFRSIPQVVETELRALDDPKRLHTLIVQSAGARTLEEALAGLHASP